MLTAPRLAERLATSLLVELYCVRPDQVSVHWPAARSLIKAAVDYTELCEFDDLEKDVLSGEQLLWLAIGGNLLEAAATTRLAKTSGKPVCILTACGGHQRERWLPLFEKIEAYAKAEGCKCVRIFGRKGWERVLSGYRVEHVILEKAF